MGTIRSLATGLISREDERPVRTLVVRVKAAKGFDLIRVEADRGVLTRSAGDGLWVEAVISGSFYQLGPTGSF